MNVPRTSWSERVRLPPLSTSVALTRGFIHDLLVEHELSYLVDDVRLVASELASNAERHARTPFTVMLEGLPDLVRLTVTDSSSLHPIRSEVQTTATRGRGLNIVGHYSSDWGVRRHGKNAKSVWATFPLRSREQVGTASVQVVPPQSSPALLAVLLREVKSARASLRAARAVGGGAPVRERQEQLVAALRLYVDALDARRLPVPYLLRDELRLYRGTTVAYNVGRADR
jgi:hypothetical protein